MNTFLLTIISLIFIRSGKAAPFFFFFLNDPPTTKISPLPLHAPLPIFRAAADRQPLPAPLFPAPQPARQAAAHRRVPGLPAPPARTAHAPVRPGAGPARADQKRGRR